MRVLTERDIARMMGEELPLPDPEELERQQIERMCAEARGRVARYIADGYLGVAGDSYRLTERGERAVAKLFYQFLLSGRVPPVALVRVVGCKVGDEYSGYFAHGKMERTWRRARKKILESLSCEERAALGLPVAKLLSPEEMVLRRMILKHCLVVNGACHG